jgi:hypothetical protein
MNAKQTTKSPTRDELTYDPTIGKYVDAQGNQYVWEGSKGKFMSEQESNAIAQEFLGRLGFKFE